MNGILLINSKHKKSCIFTSQWSGQNYPPLKFSFSLILIRDLRLSFHQIIHSKIYIFKIRKLQTCRVRGRSDCSHCRSTSLQPKLNFWFWRGSDCSHCRLTSLQAKLNLIPGGGGGPTAVTADQLHCSRSWTSDSGGGSLCPPNHSVLSTGWPLVIITDETFECVCLCLWQGIFFIKLTQRTLIILKLYNSPDLFILVCNNSDDYLWKFCKFHDKGISNCAFVWSSNAA